MMFLTKFGFVDVVRERDFPGMVTVRSSTLGGLAQFKRRTMARPVMAVRDAALWPYLLHVRVEAANSALNTHKIYGAEKIRRVSPKPVAFYYNAWQHEGDDNAQGYAWPEEVDDLRWSIDGFDEWEFYPVFEVPAELRERDAA